MSDQDPDLAQPLCIAGVEIPVQDQTPLVLLLVALIQKQATEIQQLKDEIQRLKKNHPATGHQTQRAFQAGEVEA